MASSKAEDARLGYGSSTDISKLTVSVEDLPKYGMMKATRDSKAVHRIRAGENGELQPACWVEERDERNENGEKNSYDGDFRTVQIRRRVGFSGTKLCENPECFRHVDVEDV